MSCIHWDRKEQVEQLGEMIQSLGLGIQSWHIQNEAREWEVFWKKGDPLYPVLLRAQGKG
jgi:hypothetical protein